METYRNLTGIWKKIRTSAIPAPMLLTMSFFPFKVNFRCVSQRCCLLPPQSLSVIFLSLFARFRHRPGPQPGYRWFLSLHDKLFWEVLKQAGLGAAWDAEVTLKQHNHHFTSCPALLFVPVTSRPLLCSFYSSCFVLLSFSFLLCEQLYLLDVWTLWNSAVSERQCVFPLLNVNFSHFLSLVGESHKEMSWTCFN